MQVLNFINTLSSRLGDLVLGPATRLGPWPGLLLVSLLAGAGALWVIKRVSSQAAVRRTRNRLVARVLELVLYKDDVAGVFGAFGRILLSMGPYLKENLKPLFVLIVPFILVMAQLAAWYEWRPLRPGESAVLTASVTYPESPHGNADIVSLESGEGLEIEAGPVRVPRLNEVSWRVRGATEGRHTLNLMHGDTPVPKEAVVATAMRPVSPRRVGWHSPGSALLYPREASLRKASLRRIDLVYPQRDLFLGPWRVHWLVAFFVLTMVFALALRGPMKVEL